MSVLNPCVGWTADSAEPFVPPLRLCLYIHYFQHFYIFYDNKLSAWSQQRVRPKIGTSLKWQADNSSLEVMLPIHYNLGLRYLDLRYDQ